MGLPGIRFTAGKKIQPDNRHKWVRNARPIEVPYRQINTLPSELRRLLLLFYLLSFTPLVLSSFPLFFHLLSNLLFSFLLSPDFLLLLRFYCSISSLLKYVYPYTQLIPLKLQVLVYLLQRK